MNTNKKAGIMGWSIFFLVLFLACVGLYFLVRNSLDFSSIVKVG